MATTTPDCMVGKTILKKSVCQVHVNQKVASDEKDNVCTQDRLEQSFQKTKKKTFKLHRRVKTRRTGSGLSSKGNYLINTASDVFLLIFK